MFPSCLTTISGFLTPVAGEDSSSSYGNSSSSGPRLDTNALHQSLSCARDSGISSTLRLGQHKADFYRYGHPCRDREPTVAIRSQYPSASISLQAAAGKDRERGRNRLPLCWKWRYRGPSCTPGLSARHCTAPAAPSSMRSRQAAGEGPG